MPRRNRRIQPRVTTEPPRNDRTPTTDELAQRLVSRGLASSVILDRPIHLQHYTPRKDVNA